MHISRVAQIITTLAAFTASIDATNTSPTTAAAANSDTTVFHDAETGFAFSQYFGKYSLNGRGITFRIAVPSGVQANTDFDVVVQIVAPSDVGWAGLAWGGGMLRNPLSVVWGSSSGATISSRWAECVSIFYPKWSILTDSGHYLPQPYDGASYTVLRTGTKNNGTHWQVTAKCSGCTTYGTSRTQRLSASGSNRLAFAYSASRVANPASNTSDFSEHSVIGFWDHDFGAGSNAAFTNLVAKNLGTAR